jgi:predicted small lipoprotein YifL
MRTAFIARTTLALLAGCALAACGTHGGNAVAKAPAATTVPPDVAVVRLAAGFSPDNLRLSVGQQFLLTVSASVRARGLEAAGCASATGGIVTGGLLKVRCTGGGYLYTAGHAGSTVISASVRPRCRPGQMCPEWVSEPVLHVTIT